MQVIPTTCPYGNFSIHGRHVEEPHDGEMTNQEKDSITSLGWTNFRNSQQLFGIKKSDRRHHLYLEGVEEVEGVIRPGELTGLHWGYRV